MAVITEELKAEIVSEYETRMKEFTTPEEQAQNTVSVTTAIATEYGLSVNQVRTFAMKAGVYITKGKAAAAASTKAASTGAKRVNKAEAHKALKDIIVASQQEVDDAIVESLSGKAAVYLTAVITGAMTQGE